MTHDAPRLLFCCGCWMLTTGLVGLFLSLISAMENTHLHEHFCTFHLPTVIYFKVYNSTRIMEVVTAYRETLGCSGHFYHASLRVGVVSLARCTNQREACAFLIYRPLNCETDSPDQPRSRGHPVQQLREEQRWHSATPPPSDKRRLVLHERRGCAAEWGSSARGGRPESDSLLHPTLNFLSANVPTSKDQAVYRCHEGGRSFTYGSVKRGCERGKAAPNRAGGGRASCGLGGQ